MAKPMSAASREIIDIVRAHGPIGRDQVLELSALVPDRSDMAIRLNSLTRDGHLLRTLDKKYVINGRNSTEIESPTTPNNAPRGTPAIKTTEGDLPKELLQQLSKEGRREVENSKACDIGPQTGAGKDQAPSTAPVPVAKPPLRIEDLEAPAVDSRIISVLEKAAKDAQANLDAFIREAGDLAAIMAMLIENRDRTRDLLNNYRRQNCE